MVRRARFDNANRMKNRGLVRPCPESRRTAPEACTVQPMFLRKAGERHSAFLGCPDYQLRLRRTPAPLVNDRRYLIRPLPCHLSPPSVNENLRRQEHAVSAAATEPGYSGRLPYNDNRPLRPVAPITPLLRNGSVVGGALAAALCPLSDALSQCLNRSALTRFLEPGFSPDGRSGQSRKSLPCKGPARTLRLQAE